MKTSVILTTLNEEETILDLLNSLNSQSLKPDEVIIVDAGSTDKTLEKMNSWKEKFINFPLEIFLKGGLNRSEGRNFGVQKAKNEMLAFLDAGCVADEKWLEEIVTPFENKNVESVAGFYEPTYENDWSEVFSWFTSVFEDDVDEGEFLPSARSFSVLKKVLLQIDGFPEELKTCEDLIVSSRLKQRGTMKVNLKAVVYWAQETDLNSFFFQISGYANGDILAKYRPHTRKISLIYLRYFIFILFPPLFFFYLFFPVVKFRNKIRTKGLFIRSIICQVTADLAVMHGSFRGVVGKN